MRALKGIPSHSWGGDMESSLLGTVAEIDLWAKIRIDSALTPPGTKGRTATREAVAYHIALPGEARRVGAKRCFGGFGGSTQMGRTVYASVLEPSSRNSVRRWESCRLALVEVPRAFLRGEGLGRRGRQVLDLWWGFLTKIGEVADLPLLSHQDISIAGGTFG